VLCPHLFLRSLDDADEEERESFRLSESQGKRVEVVIDGDVRGMLVIYPKKTFLNVRNQIYRVCFASFCSAP
jgi:hypothetical protein